MKNRAVIGLLLIGTVLVQGCVIGFPSFAGVLMGCQAARGLQALGEVVGSQERRAVCAQLVVALVVVALDRGVLQGPVHSLDLTSGPGMIGFC